MGGHAAATMGDGAGKESGDDYMEYFITEYQATLFPLAAHEAFKRTKAAGSMVAYATHPENGRAVIGMSRDGAYIIWRETK